MPQIRYLKRSSLDADKWNACIDAAGNGLIYAHTFYLDAMCDNWDALVINDYEAVMPLPWRKKWGLHYLYYPFAVAQLGVFGNDVTPELLYGVLKKIPLKFRYWHMPLNFGNCFTIPDFTLHKRKNFVLKLARPYEELQAAYRQQHKRNLKKAATQKIVLQRNISIDDVIVLAKMNKAAGGKAKDFIRFKKLSDLLEARRNAVIYGAVSANGLLLAAAVFFFSNSRAYYILPGNHPAGRAAGASHYLIDQFIKDHAGSNLILDFEGSDIPGLQFFYSSFGAVEEPYTAIRYNRLPWFVKWLKK